MNCDAARIAACFDNPGGKVTLGIDGFVDEVWQVISVRKSENDFTLFNKMRDFAKAVYDCGEGGYANEIIHKRRSYGGFTANTGKAVGRLGIDTTLLGLFGHKTVDPVFEDFSDFCRFVSAGNPGRCQIFEFLDGKLMLPYVEEITRINWAYLVDTMSVEKLGALFLDADIVGLGYWSQLRYFDELVAKLCEHFLLPGKCSRLFFDLADIRKRDKHALLNTLQSLTVLGKKIPMTVSLNEHEAERLFSYMGRDFAWDKPDNADKDIDYVRRQTGLDELIVHTPYFAVASTATEGTVVRCQRYCENPVITTGAGDNFNGGYVAASACQDKLSLAERLAVGNAVTGFYVTNGYSPNKTELIDFIGGE